MTYQTPCFATRFASTISAHRAGAFLAGATRTALTLYNADDLEVVWAPFDHIATGAKLAIAGITPGATQAENANGAFRSGLAGGLSPVEAARRAKMSGAFSGPMRNNLVAMLDHVGANKLFGISTCAELFEPGCELLHVTSVLRHPVFFRSGNYNGSPDMLRTPTLKSMIDTHLAAEVSALPKVLWLPLGGKPAAALRHLAAQGLLSTDRILDGMPHPSGANAERIACFLGRKHDADLSVKTRPERIIAARNRLRAQLARLAPSV